MLQKHPTCTSLGPISTPHDSMSIAKEGELEGALPVQAGMRPVVSLGEVPWKSLCVVKTACGLLVMIS